MRRNVCTSCARWASLRRTCRSVRSDGLRGCYAFQTQVIGFRRLEGCIDERSVPSTMFLCIKKHCPCADPSPALSGGAIAAANVLRVPACIRKATALASGFQRVVQDCIYVPFGAQSFSEHRSWHLLVLVFQDTAANANAAIWKGLDFSSQASQANSPVPGSASIALSASVRSRLSRVSGIFWHPHWQCHSQRVEHFHMRSHAARRGFLSCRRTS